MCQFPYPVMSYRMKLIRQPLLKRYRSVCLERIKSKFYSLICRAKFLYYLPDHRRLSQPVAKHLAKFPPIEGEVEYTLL